MRDVAEATDRWVRQGHITKAQREAILASEGAPASVRSKAAPTLVLTGPRAELFVAGIGAFLTFMVAWMLDLFYESPYTLASVAGVFALVGLTLFFGLRGGAIWADVAFAVCLWLAAFAAIEMDSEWSDMAAISWPVILMIGVLRLPRLVISIPAVPLTFMYVTGAIPAVDELVIWIGAPILLVVAAVLLFTLRHRTGPLVARLLRRDRAEDPEP